MKSRKLIVSTILLAVAAALLAGSAAQTAENREEGPTSIDAVMRLDVQPLLKKLDSLEGEMVVLRTINEQMNEKMQSMQQNMQKLQEAVEALQQPRQWQYKFSRVFTEKEANEGAKQGWELINGGLDGGKGYLIFRKPAAETSEENK